MKLLMLGATGGTGRELVSQALEGGHSVTALARDPVTLAARDDLRVLAGDVLDPESVRRAVEGQDAVLFAVGRPAMSPGKVRSEGTRNLVRAMESVGPRRLVSLSTIGIGESRPLLPPLHRFVLAPSLLRRTLAEHARQESIVRSSELEWTIVRAGVLTDGARSGTYHHGFPSTERSLEIEISRADVAEFMLGLVTGSTYLRETASVSY